MQETEDVKPLFPLDTAGDTEESWAWSSCMSSTMTLSSKDHVQCVPELINETLQKYIDMTSHEDVDHGRGDNAGVCRLQSGFF